jgi:hypothetical protein
VFLWFTRGNTHARNIINSIAFNRRPLLHERGFYIQEAQKWVDENQPVNFCGHMTVKALGLEPAQTRAVCESYSHALVLKPMGRLDFGREYTLEEVLQIGVTAYLISKL